MVVLVGQKVRKLKIPETAISREVLRRIRSAAHDMGVRSRCVHKPGRYCLTLVGEPREVELAAMLFEVRA